MASCPELGVADTGPCRPWRDGRVERLGRVGHWYWPAGAERLWWSDEAARIHGRATAGDGTLLDAVVADFSGQDGARLLKALNAALTTGAGFDFEAELVLSDGARRTVRVTGEGDPDPSGYPIGVLAVVQEIAAPDASAVPAAPAAREADLADFCSHWFWQTGPDLRFTFISPQVERLVGTSAEFHIGKTPAELFGDDEIPPGAEQHLEAIARREPFELGCWRRGLDGRKRYVSTAGKPFFAKDGAFLGYRGVGRDLTAEQRVKERLLAANLQLEVANVRIEDALADLRRANALLAERNAEMARAQAGIRYTALHDTLTGLPNRRYLDEKLPALAEAARRHGTSLAALHVDLDRFKQINDTLGYAAGDAVLRHAAGVLLRSVTGADFVARVGGDEFVVICAGSGAAALEALARKLIAELERPLVFEGRECWFGASVGIAAMSGAETGGDELLVNADIALYRAKKHGGGGHAFFSTEIQNEIVRYKATADGVLAGLKRAEFVPYYQPQISSDCTRIVGVEALARWRHPAEGVLAPDRFLHVADDLGVVAALDSAILEHATADLRRWVAAGLDVPKLSVNVSARRLLDRDLIRSVSQLDLPRGTLSFELLESVFLDEVDETISWNIDMLKEMGIDIELDDFGSGHASIVSLVKLGPTAIKIDRELVSPMTEDRTRFRLVRSIIEICRPLGTRVIAEGVETGAQAELLHDLGCDALQGYHFGKPMPADEFEQFVIGWGRREPGVFCRTG